MPDRRYRARWEWRLQSSPEALWPLLSDTNRLDHDSGLPVIERLTRSGPPGPGVQRIRQRIFGLSIEYDELPFEWVRPQRYGVVRRYHQGPLKEARAQMEFHSDPDGGTRLVFAIEAEARHLAARLLLPWQMRSLKRAFQRVVLAYDRSLARGRPPRRHFVPAGLTRAGRQRLSALAQSLRAETAPPELVDRLVETLSRADDLDVGRLRPYALADAWGRERREVLELCLRATRCGILDLQWDLLCPMCRGAADSRNHLGEVSSRVHCEGCNIDFSVNFEHSVELTFRPNPAIRTVERREYCTGGPGATPHVVMQQRLEPGACESVALQLEPGRYRLRCSDLPGGRFLRVETGGAPEMDLSPTAEGWPPGESSLAPSNTVILTNLHREEERIYVLERTAWSDQATTGAEVAVLQTFRDLFASEALRPGEQISVGSLVVLFTDLRDSTRLYREIGDAPAFGRVMTHFDVLRGAITRQQGALVKTGGDAVMAVFRQPAPALRAILSAQAQLARGPAPLRLKAGLHVGPCIAVNLNDRLDYFGSTVNLAARLEHLSSGDDVIVSRAVLEDADVDAMLKSGIVLGEPFHASLRGFDEQSFQLWRIRPACPPEEYELPGERQDAAPGAEARRARD